MFEIDKYMYRERQREREREGRPFGKSSWKIFDLMLVLRFVSRKNNTHRPLTDRDPRSVPSQHSEYNIATVESLSSRMAPVRNALQFFIPNIGKRYIVYRNAYIVWRGVP